MHNSDKYQWLSSASLSCDYDVSMLCSMSELEYGSEATVGEKTPCENKNKFTSTPFNYSPIFHSTFPSHTSKLNSVSGIEYLPIFPQRIHSHLSGLAYDSDPNYPFIPIQNFSPIPTLSINSHVDIYNPLIASNCIQGC